MLCYQQECTDLKLGVLLGNADKTHIGLIQLVSLVTLNQT